MDAWRYGIYLLVFTFDISLVRCAHSFDIECEHKKINSISLRDHVLFSICPHPMCEKAVFFQRTGL